jgi:hypothetical protein
MSPAIENQNISHLERTDAATLRRLWAKSRGIEPPKTFTARLMRLALAWDAQAASEGCETTKARRDWDRIIKGRGEGGPINRAGNALRTTASVGTRHVEGS